MTASMLAYRASFSIYDVEIDHDTKRRTEDPRYQCGERQDGLHLSNPKTLFSELTIGGLNAELVAVSFHAEMGERLKPPDCKSGPSRVRRFESSSLHLARYECV